MNFIVTFIASPLCGIERIHKIVDHGTSIAEVIRVRVSGVQAEVSQTIHWIRLAESSSRLSYGIFLQAVFAFCTGKFSSVRNIPLETLS